MVFWRESLLVEFSPLMRIYPLWQHYISMTSQPWANPVRRVTSNFCLSLSLSHTHSLFHCLSLELLSKHILLHYRPSLTLFLCHSRFPILPVFWLIRYILLTSLAARFLCLYIHFHLFSLPQLDIYSVV